MMNAVYYHEIRKVNNEISNSAMDAEKIAEVKRTYEHILKLSNLARTEGLLAIEEYVENANEEFGEQFMQEFCEMVMDGTDSKDIMEIGLTEYMSRNLHSYDSLIYLLYFRGFLLIQEGAYPHLVEKKLQSMMPNSISSTFHTATAACEDTDDIGKKRIEKLCEGGEIDRTDHTLCGQTAIVLCEMTDRDVQRLLREADQNDLMIVMKGLPGKARKRIFDNISERLGEMIAEDMEYAGPVRMCDVEECCYQMMNHLITLENTAQVSTDVTVMKVVMDIYRSNNDRLNEIKEKYKKLKSIIDDIL